MGIEALVQQANLGEISMKHEELNISHEFFFNIYIYIYVCKYRRSSWPETEIIFNEEHDDKPWDWLSRY